MIQHQGRCAAAGSLMGGYSVDGPVGDVQARIAQIQQDVRARVQPTSLHFAQLLQRHTAPVEPPASAPEEAQPGNVATTLGAMLGMHPGGFSALSLTGARLWGGVTGAPFHGVSLVSPLAGETGSGFGHRTHPITGEYAMHTGIDRGAPTGTPVRAAAAGVVVRAGPNGGYGNFVEIDHGGGVTTRYAHHDELAVRTGDVVAAGQTIGTVGSTGRSTGPHLHFELRHDGVAVDPEPYLP